MCRKTFNDTILLYLCNGMIHVILCDNLYHIYTKVKSYSYHIIQYKQLVSAYSFIMRVVILN